MIIICPYNPNVSKEEIVGGAQKTLSFQIGLLRKIDAIINANIDPVITLFEKLQNFLTQLDHFAGVGTSYLVVQRDTVSMIDADNLDDYKVVNSVFDIKIESYVKYDGQ